MFHRLIYLSTLMQAWLEISGVFLGMISSTLFSMCIGRETKLLISLLNLVLFLWLMTMHGRDSQWITISVKKKLYNHSIPYFYL